MKIVGLITEYNPFHNGHKYHIEKAKDLTGADYVIAVMSGDFVQRGAPALLPKHLRTAMALEGGCDLVIELPVCFATGSAEYFAAGAISILDNLGCIDAVCFGSESGDYHSLEKIARVVAYEPDQYKFSLQNYLKSGLSYPLARQKALTDYFADTLMKDILNEPNNILGIEYIKAMILNSSSMTGYTVTRTGSAYHDTELKKQYSSASAIRNLLAMTENSCFDQLNEQLSEYALTILKDSYSIRYPVVLDDLSLLLKYRLLAETKDSLTQYADISSELANRIINLRNEFISCSQFIELLKTKDMTYSRISRCLIHIILNIKNCNPASSAYARVLGFRKDSSELFSHIKKSSKIPLITKPTVLNTLSDEQRNIFLQDVFASDLYESIIADKFSRPFINELTKQIIKL